MVRRQLKLGPPLDYLVQRAVMLLETNAPPGGAPFYGCFSGGKDSVVIKELARMAGVSVAWHYNVIIDPPELMRFIKTHHPEVEWLYCKHGPFFRRIRQKLLVPTRFRRWCCREYKHNLGPKGCTRILGIRVDESNKRARNYPNCVSTRPGKRHEIYPIRLWTDENVWRFIRQRNLPYCSLYDEGFERLGCVGCPLTSPKARRREFDRWPRFEQMWREACAFVVAERARLGLTPPPESLRATWENDHRGSDGRADGTRERERERETGRGALAMVAEQLTVGR